jgi:hypothetical protein
MTAIGRLTRRYPWVRGFRILGALKLGAIGAPCCAPPHEFAFPSKRMAHNGREVGKARLPLQRFADLRGVRHYLRGIALTSHGVFNLEINV